jgi:hypothetical protein
MRGGGHRPGRARGRDHRRRPRVAGHAMTPVREWFRKGFWYESLDEDLEAPFKEALPESARWRTEARAGDAPFAVMLNDVEVEGLRHPWLHETASTLAGRLEAVLKERQALRTQVAELLDQRARWVRLLQLAMEDRDAWVALAARARAREGR